VLVIEISHGSRPIRMTRKKGGERMHVVNDISSGINVGIWTHTSRHGLACSNCPQIYFWWEVLNSPCPQYGSLFGQVQVEVHGRVNEKCFSISRFITALFT
jgi:hypothetical protein